MQKHVTGRTACRMRVMTVSSEVTLHALLGVAEVKSRKAKLLQAVCSWPIDGRQATRWASMTAERGKPGSE